MNGRIVRARRAPWRTGARWVCQWVPAVDQCAADFLASLLGGRPRCVALTFAASLVVSLLETGSMAVLAVAVQHFLIGNPGATLARLGPIGDSMRPLIDRLGHEALGLSLVVLAVLSQVLRCLAQFASEALTVTLSTSLLTDLRRRLFCQFMTMSYQQFGKHKLGELVGWFDQADRIAAMLRQVVALVTQLFVSASFVVVLLWLSWSMTLQALGLIAVLFWPLFTVLARVRQVGRQELKARVRVSQRLIEYLAAFRLVQTFSLQKHIAAQFDSVLHASARAVRRGTLLNSAVRPGSEAVTYVAGLTVLLALYWLNSAAEAVLPSLICFTLVLYRLVPHINQVTGLLPGIIGGWPVIRSLAEQLPVQAARRPTGGDPGPAGWISFREVTFTYEGNDRPALREVSFSIPPGKMTAIVGRSGAGKTTALNLLLQLCRPTDGAITHGGVDLTSIEPDRWRARIGLVDQDAFLFHASVRENIRLGKTDASDEEVRQAAVTAGADEFVRELADGYDTLIGDRGHRLSGGQRQRLAIARALVRDPQILILDEGTSNLDSESERLIQQALRRLRAERTVICIAHRLSTVTEADQILVLERGELAECGTHQELLRKGGHYYRFWQLQASTEEPRSREEPNEGHAAA